MCVLLKPREAVDQHTLVEVPLFGQIKLSELLALGANRPIDFFFPLTTVDGRREDDICVTAKSRTEQNPDLEQSSFRSLFQAEGCPAPFMLGSRFYCFHCPGTAPVPEAGDKLRIGHVFFPRSFSALSSDTETVSMDRGSSEKDNENEEKLALMYEKLRIEVQLKKRLLFLKPFLTSACRPKFAITLTLLTERCLSAPQVFSEES